METITHNKYKVDHVRDLTDSTYIVRMERNGMEFQPGQNLNLGLAGDTKKGIIQFTAVIRMSSWRSL